MDIKLMGVSFLICSIFRFNFLHNAKCSFSISIEIREHHQIPDTCVHIGVGFIGLVFDQIVLLQLVQWIMKQLMKCMEQCKPMFQVHRVFNKVLGFWFSWSGIHLPTYNILQILCDIHLPIPVFLIMSFSPKQFGNDICSAKAFFHAFPVSFFSP